MKTKLPVYPLLGALAVTAAVAGLIVRLTRHSLGVVVLIVYALIFCGGALLLVLGLFRRSPAIAPVGKKPTDSPLAERLRKASARLPSVLILTLAAAIFLAAYDRAQKTESIPQSSVQTGIVYTSGRVIAIEGGAYQGQQDCEDVPIGKQLCRVEITSGKHKGEQYSLTNNLSYLYGTVLEEGDSVTVSIAYTDGEVSEVLLQDYNRTVPLTLVLAAFLLVTVLVGGKVGAKSLIGLALTIVCVFAVLLPLLLDGAPTLPTVLAMCSYVTVVEFVLLDGVNKKTVCAILGTISGVVFAMLFGELACALLRVDGFKMYVAEPHVEALLQIKQGQDPMSSLRIGDLLVGGILIAALGAVNDVAMSISSSMNELVTVNPSLSRRDLLRSGMNIGRDMVGTMTNTLILALVGNSLVMILYLSSLEPSFTQLMSTAFLSVEMVQALASSIGVILAVPLSVVIGMLLYGHPTRKTKP